jgi:hypothetical protein
VRTYQLYFPGSRITKPPAAIPDVTLNCYMRGQDSKHVFSVRISRKDTVAVLRNAIKSERPVDLRDIEAGSLTLYKFSLPYDESIEKTLMGLIFDHEKPLSVLDPLFDIFPELPPQKHVHIIVEAPLSGKSECCSCSSRCF